MHPPKKSIPLGPHLILDPHPSDNMRSMFMSYEQALRELLIVIGNARIMAELRALLPHWLASSAATDHKVLEHIAVKVEHRQLAIREKPAHGGTLPWDTIVQDLTRFEGWQGKPVPHMYRDSKGFVTIGVGEMIPSAKETENIAFTVRATGKPATVLEKHADYKKVYAQPFPQICTHYKADLVISDEESKRLLLKSAERSLKEVSAEFKGFDKYPVPVRQVLIDMRFNMGPNLRKFKNFKHNLELARENGLAKYWKLAADESFRKDLVDKKTGKPGARNDWAHMMILKGGGVTK